MFFGRPEFVLLIGLGTLLPDLDREYWFIPRRAYRDEQLHRAALHNVFVMVLTYFVSPFLSLGVFLHVLQDSFTTAKDRGVEWFFPLTRKIKRGLYNADGQPQPLNPKEHVYFFQEDPIGLVDYADLDLREEGPVPWRRVYGPAQNSNILDRSFLFGSIVILLIWFANTVITSRFSPIQSFFQTNWGIWAIGFGWIVLLYGAGQLDRRDKPLRITKLIIVKYPLFAFGLIALGAWLWLYRNPIISNLQSIFSEPVPVLLGAVLTSLASLLVVEWKKSGGRDAVF
ncbi:MAG: metal-dependent hydrolase [Nitrososphaerales archaeon]|nr:metal-dependent hydrolase [Nitrososphaerales archaeon]